MQNENAGSLFNIPEEFQHSNSRHEAKHSANAGAACPGVACSGGCPGTLGQVVLISNHQQRQCPGDSKGCSRVGCGQRGALTVWGRKERAWGRGQEGRYDRDTWKNTGNPGRGEHFRMEGPEAGLEHMLCREARAEGGGAGVRLRLGAHSQSPASGLLPPLHLFHTHTPLHTYIHVKHTFFPFLVPFFCFVPSLLSSVFHSHPPLVPWPGLSLSSPCPASFLLSFPYTPPCFGWLGKLRPPWLLPSCIRRLTDWAPRS